MSTASKHSFAGGEWSPSLYGRTDIAKHPTALKKAYNTICHPHGGMSNRGGSAFVSEAKYSGNTTRLVSFQFSVEQHYVLEFGNKYMRVHKDGARVVESNKTVTGATQANPVVITSNGHGFSDGQYITINNVSGMTELNNKDYIVASAAANNFALKDVDGNNVDGTGYTAYTSGGIANRIYEITTTYADADLFNLKFVQSADVLKVTHPGYPPRDITRTDHTAWTIANIAFATSMARPAPWKLVTSGTFKSSYVVSAVNAQGEESLYSWPPLLDDPGVKIAFNAVSNAVYYNVYKGDADGGSFGWIGRVVTPTSTYPFTFQEPTNGIEPDYSLTPVVNNVNPFSGANNYPGVSTFFGQRWVAARTNNAPQDFLGSVVAAFNNFNKSYPLRDDDSYNFTINARQVNEIKALVPLDYLLIFTAGGEFRATGGGGSGAITPSSIDVPRISSWGISDLEPLVIGKSVLFVEKSGSIVRDLQYELASDGYDSEDLSLFADHFFTDYTIVSWCYQQFPDSIAWLVRDDGKILGLTYNRKQQVYAWHLHETDGSYEDVTSVTNEEGVDELWAIVNRTIEGVTRRYVERFMPRLPVNSDHVKLAENSYCVDCGLKLDTWNTTSSYTLELTGGVTWAAGEEMALEASGHTPFVSGHVGRYFRLRYIDNNYKSTELGYIKSVDVLVTAYVSNVELTVKPFNRAVPEELRATPSNRWALLVTTLYGLDHLEGKDVSVLADGNVVPNLTISSGGISLPSPTAIAVVGLGYVSDMVPLDFILRSQEGSTEDKLKAITSLRLKLDNTRALFAGPNEDYLDEVKFRTDEEYGDQIRLFTGHKEVDMQADEDEFTAGVFFRNIDPLPVTILSVFARDDYGEE